LEEYKEKKLLDESLKRFTKVIRNLEKEKKAIEEERKKRGELKEGEEGE